MRVCVTDDRHLERGEGREKGCVRVCVTDDRHLERGEGERERGCACVCNR